MCRCRYHPAAHRLDSCCRRGHRRFCVGSDRHHRATTRLQAARHCLLVPPNGLLCSCTSPSSYHCHQPPVPSCQLATAADALAPRSVEQRSLALHPRGCLLSARCVAQLLSNRQRAIARLRYLPRCLHSSRSQAADLCEPPGAVAFLERILPALLGDRFAERHLSFVCCREQAQPSSRRPSRERRRPLASASSRSSAGLRNKAAYQPLRVYPLLICPRGGSKSACGDARLLC